MPARYVIPAHLTEVIEALALHGGIHGGRVKDGMLRDVSGPLREFIVDLISRALRPFEGHHEVRLSGRWVDSDYSPGPEDFVVTADGAIAPHFVYLLDPESDDGLVTWNVLDKHLRQGAPFPIRRVTVQAR